MSKSVGRSITRVDAYEKATGRAKYMDDLCDRSALIAKVKHSTIAHGYVKSVDTAEAEQVPGVVKILTCFDAPDRPFPTAGHPWSMDPHHQDVADRMLLNRHVRYYGDDVAVVVAEDEVAAAQAVRLIKVEYDELPFVLDPQEAMKPDAPQLHEKYPGNVLAHTDIRRGPFIVVSGHDLDDLAQLLEQTAGTGINIYTHGEMLPAHGYPGLKKYPHLAGNFGTAWQNQQKELENIPAPVLFTTNCLMPPRESYRDRVFTTGVVGFAGLPHIPADENGRKDFSPLIRRARELGGWDTDRSMSGINGGHILQTGFARSAVLSQAPQLLEAIRSGAVKHIFLVGGCDGAHPGRNYYTQFVQRAPMDSLILTLACGKFRFNDLDLGDIGGIPRILDVGQCNDAYSAIRIAQALAEAFQCDINQLPLTLVLSWYEQKAVCILLTLLALGIKNIYLGPTLPAFLSEGVVQTLVQAFDLQPTTAPQQDLDAILHRG